MQLAAVLALIVGLVSCQLDEETEAHLGELFPPKPTTSTSTECTSGLCLPDGFVTVKPTEKSGNGGGGYIAKCGEGKQKGKMMCVNYQYCDPTTQTIVPHGLIAGFGLINIRFGENKCNHPLESCCKIPPGGLNPTLPPTTTTTPAPTKPTSTSAPVAPTKPSRPTPPVKAPSTCGIRNENGIDFKITGDNHNEAEYGEFPWMVALVKKSRSVSDESFSFCGGSLINPSVVLTGAHCVDKYHAENIKIRVGEWDSQTTRERLPYQEREVLEIISHIHYVPAGLFNDFALLILDRPVDQAEHIGTICLPEQDQVVLSKNCFVSGWGKNIFGTEGKYQHILKKVELPMVPVDKCEAALKTTVLGPTYLLHDSFVCAGGEEGKDACTGDGGSPLVCPDPNNPSRYVLTGMVAWGIGCGEQNIPGVYANVAKFRNWIDDNVKRRRLDTSSYVL